MNPIEENGLAIDTSRDLAVRNIRAILEYDGIGYFGFQRLPSRPTIQGTVERALARITLEEIKITGAGRTDAGAHALGQVVNFRTEWTHSIPELHRAVNALLPDDIVIREMSLVSDDFHARFSAVLRHYRYSVINQRLPSPLLGRFSYHVSDKLNVPEMADAARTLMGTQDYASFADGNAKTTVRTIISADCLRQENMVRFDFVLNAAFSHMIRRIVGSLLWVGMGRIDHAEFQQIVAAKDPGRSAPPVPARGLCLVRVDYGDADPQS
jgi:tRNA pseudouridine38-40 synthase